MKNIVFVSGNFNILHPGHLRLLKFAKESGDYLVVGVVSDAQAKDTTLLDEAIRLESIQATSYVDEAFLLNESVESYLERAKPAIVVKGKEFETRLNPELEIVKRYGGKLIFSSGEIGFSSIDALKHEFFDNTISSIRHSHEYLKRHGIDLRHLADITELFKTLKVLVVGDTIIDEYITCDALGMSQEDPTIVVSPIMNDRFIGGAAIVAAHAKSMGASVTFVSVIGDDTYADYMQDRLTSMEIDVYLMRDATRPTTLKQRFRAESKTLLRVNHLKQHSIDKEIQDRILQQLKAIIEGIDLIILSDFSYGVLSSSMISKIEAMAKEQGVFVVADSQSSSQIGDISKFNNMDLVTPTEREIRLALNDFQSGLVVLSEKLVNKSNPKYILTTLGSEGVMIYNTKKDELLTDRLPAMNLLVKDVSGAGDSMLTCASMALAVGATIWESAYLGSLAAAIQVGRIGNIPIEKTELLNELK